MIVNKVLREKHHHQWMVEKWKMVVEQNFSPGRNTVDGN